MKSIWEKTADLSRFEKLRGDAKADVLIIGGGIAGILCAYMLRRAGVDCLLAEAGRVAGRVTGKTTAKITVQHGLIYDRIIRRYGEEAARTYLQAQTRAAEEYRELCRGIRCGYEERDSYVYSMRDRGRIEREVEAINRIGGVAELADSVDLPFSIAGAVRVPGQGQLDPLKFLAEVSRELPIYENTKVVELRPDGAVTDGGKISAEKIIVATHYPFLNKHGAYFLKLYQHRSYVLALEGVEEIDGMYVDENERGLSFRSYGNTLLLGGGSHRTGKRGGGWQELQRFAKEHYPDAKEVSRWATQDCMSLDGIPYIGQYAQSTQGLYVATGFNKWGMTSSMVSALLLCDLVQGRKNDWEKLFSPSRSILHPQLAINAAESVIGLLTPTAPRCPHLGCALKYNAEEHSWDCPCHGSRFDEKGAVIDNPATDDKKRMPKKNSHKTNS